MLFQVRQTYDDDDIEIVRKTEKKKYRIGKATAIYMRFSAVAGILGLICLSVILVWKTVLVLWGHAMAILLSVICWEVFGIVMLFLPACTFLFQFAFPKEKGKKSPQEKELVFSFEEDHFSVDDGQDESTISYRSLDKFLEKDDHFLLYAPGGCFPIRKSCFVVGTPEEFGPFIREKYRTKDMDTPEKGLDET